MSAQIKYAYLKGQTWLYRRNYPPEIAMVLGSQAMKQSLKTGDTQTARVRAAEVNVQYEALVARIRTGAKEALSAPRGRPGEANWGTTGQGTLQHLRSTLAASGTLPKRLKFEPPAVADQVTVMEIGRAYLRRRSVELRPGGFKSVRYSLGLFISKYGDRTLASLSRDDGRQFLALLPQLSPLIGKSVTTRGLGMDGLLSYSSQGTARIRTVTQKRIWSQVNHFLDWTIYEGRLELNPFRTVRFDQKVKMRSYAVPTDEEVRVLLNDNDELLHPIMLTCLLTGMRAGEAAGLMREDLVAKGNLGTFVHVRPNEHRDLKTDAADRLVPVHPVLDELFSRCPAAGRLFPGLTVDAVSKRFARVRQRVGLERPGLVFHSTRKWFVTQCERTGVPEHWTASLVGHQSARSGNGLTYGIYSAGISNEQKRTIVDQLRLPS